MARPRPLKVFATNKMVRIDGKVDQRRCVVAAASQIEAAQLLNISLHEFRGYAGQTGNGRECEVALSQPGRVFAQATEGGPACTRQFRVLDETSMGSGMSDTSSEPSKTGRVFTDEQVIQMRREAHKTGRADLRRWSKFHRRSQTTVGNAICGRTYPELGEAFVSPRLKADEVKLLFEMRLQDPAGWTLHLLAQFANDRWGTKLQGTNITRLIIRHHGYVPERPADAAPAPAVRRASTQARRPEERSFRPSKGGSRLLPRVDEDEWPTVELDDEHDGPAMTRSDRAPREPRLVDLSDPENRQRVAQRILAMREGYHA